MKTIENIRHDAQSLHKDSDILEVRDVLIATLEAMEIMDYKDDSNYASDKDDNNYTSDISDLDCRLDDLNTKIDYLEEEINNIKGRIDSLEEDDRDSVINALEDDWKW